MSGYIINEDDIEKMLRFLELHDPKNADRDYAVQLLEQYRSLGANLSRNDEDLADVLVKKLQDDEAKAS